MDINGKIIIKGIKQVYINIGIPYNVKNKNEE